MASPKFVTARLGLEATRNAWSAYESSQRALFPEGEAWDRSPDFQWIPGHRMVFGRSRRSSIPHRIVLVNVKPSGSTSTTDGSAESEDQGDKGCYIQVERRMSKLLTDEFQLAVGSPANQERTYLVGQGKFIGDDKALLVHTLPVYRQKDYPKYQTRKAGPYVVALARCGVRISATNEKMVFAKAEDAINFAAAIGGLFALYGIPLQNDDPRVVLEKSREVKEQILPAVKALAKEFGAEFISPAPKKE
jgi:hypothetical protein